MPVLDASTAGKIKDSISSGTPSLGSLASEEQVQFRQEWDEIINKKLIEWGKNPEQLEDDDFIPPSASSILNAHKLVETLRDSGKEPPTMVVPDGEGGIVFEFRKATYFYSVSVDEKNATELLIKGDKVSRRVINITE